AKAARYIRLAEAGADEPGLAALRPICDAELARLAEAEGDLARARRRVDRAFAGIPQSPFVVVDREVLHGRMPAVLSDGPPVARAYAQLRGAEHAITVGALQEARDAAAEAERFYSASRMLHETARARLVRAEAHARLGDHELANESLIACDELAGAC